jgi:MFS family permease
LRQSGSDGSDELPALRLPGGLAPLGYRNFALYWAGFATSNLGRWMEQTGAVWLAWELTESPVLLGVLGLVRGLPALAFTPIAGVIADRVDQRRILVATQASALLLSLALGLLVVTGRVELWHIYVQAAAQSAVFAFDMTTRQALFPRLVPRARLVEAVTLQSLAGRTSAMIGPAIGGIVIATLGEAAPFLLSTITNVALIAGVAGMRDVPRVTASAGASIRSELLEGLQYMLATPVLAGVLKLEIVYALFQMNPVMVTIIGRDVLGVGPAELGALLAADGIGALVGIAILLTAGQRARPGRFVILGTIAYATALVGFAAAREYPVAFVALLVAGMFDTLVATTRNSIMQLVAPPEMRGRVIGNHGLVVRGLPPLAQAQSGFIAGAIGGPLAIVTAAAALVAGSLVTGRTNRALMTWSSDEAARGG